MKSKRTIAAALTLSLAAVQTFCVLCSDAEETDTISVVKSSTGITVRVIGEDYRNPEAETDGEEFTRIYFREDNAPFVDESGRTQIPVRAFSEAAKFSVDWNAQTQTVTVTKSENVITMRIGSNTVTVNGENKIIDTAPVIVNDYTYVPLRCIGETFGFEVDYSEPAEVKSYTTPIEDMWKF